MSAGWAARASSSRSTCTRWSTTCPVAPAPTPRRWPTAQRTSSTASSARTSAGRTPAGPGRSWTSTNPQPGIASAPCCPWRAPRWLPSTAATATTCSSSPGAKGRARPTSSARSSRRSSTTKWTSCPGSSARATGAGITRPGPPTTDTGAPRAPPMRTTSSSFKRPGSIKETPPLECRAYRSPADSRPRQRTCICHAGIYPKAHQGWAPGPRNCRLKPPLPSSMPTAPLELFRGRDVLRRMWRKKWKKYLEAVVGGIQLTSDSVVPREAMGPRDWNCKRDKQFYV